MFMRKFKDLMFMYQQDKEWYAKFLFIENCLKANNIIH